MRRAKAGAWTEETAPLAPLRKEEAVACRGGGDDPIKQLIDWVAGGNPRPDQWPPQIG